MENKDDKADVDRRKLSQSGLLESAIRAITPLTTASDPNTRALASRALGDLVKLRRDMPKRRKVDGSSRA